MPPTKCLRQAVQILALAAFVSLLALSTWPLRSPVSPSLFLRADPLAALAVALSPFRSVSLLRLFWPALLLSVLTIFAGRFFCGWLCPLGTCVDASDRLIGRRGQAAPHRAQIPALKYVLLVGVLAAALTGTHLFWLLDPLPLLTRTLATVADPALRLAYNTGLDKSDTLLRTLGLRLEPVPVHPFALNVLVLAIFVGLLSLGRFSRRYWCRNLCPLGALLGLLGRWGLWRRHVREGCVSCQRCAADCKMGAIPREEPITTRQAECIQCYDCLACCRPNCTTIGLTLAGSMDRDLNIERRRFLGIATLGLVYGAVTASGAGRKPRQARLVRPPGALVRRSNGEFRRMMSEEEFRAKCLRCGQCMKACITGAIQPSVVDAGWDGFYTPIVVPRVGFCEQSCAACGQVCPSGALTPFSLEEKKDIKIGLASVDHNRCLAWRQGPAYKECLVCDEHCSYKAIRVINDNGQRRPTVDGRICVGCGICEWACPMKPEAAIIVYRRGTVDER